MVTVGPQTANLRDASQTATIKATSSGTAAATGIRSPKGGCGAGPEAAVDDAYAGWIYNLLLGFDKSEYGIGNTSIPFEPGTLFLYKMAADGTINVFPTQPGSTVEHFFPPPQDAIQSIRDLGAALNPQTIVIPQIEGNYPTTVTWPNCPATAEVTEAGSTLSWSSLGSPTSRVGASPPTTRWDTVITFDLRLSPFVDLTRGGNVLINLAYWVEPFVGSFDIEYIIGTTPPSTLTDTSSPPFFGTVGLAGHTTLTGSASRQKVLFQLFPVDFNINTWLHIILSPYGGGTSSGPLLVDLTVPGFEPKIEISNFYQEQYGFRPLTRSGDTLTVGNFQKPPRLLPAPLGVHDAPESILRLDDSHFATVSATSGPAGSLNPVSIEARIELYELVGTTITRLTATTIPPTLPELSFNPRVALLHTWGGDHLLIHQATSPDENIYTHHFWVYTYDYTSGCTLVYSTTRPFRTGGSHGWQTPYTFFNPLPQAGRRGFPDFIVFEQNQYDSPNEFDILPGTWNGTALQFGAPLTITPYPAPHPTQVYPTIPLESADHYTIVTYSVDFTQRFAGDQPNSFTCVTQNGTVLTTECGPKVLANSLNALTPGDGVENPTVNVIGGQSYVVFGSQHFGPGPSETLQVGTCGARGQAAFGQQLANLHVREPV